MIYICTRCFQLNGDNWPMPVDWQEGSPRPVTVWGHCQKCWETAQNTNYRRQLLAVIQASGMTRQEINEILDEVEEYIKANKVPQ